MSPFLLRQFHATQEQQREIVSSIEGLSAAQRAWKDRPDTWSPLQIAEHLILSYETVGSREWAQAQREASGKRPRAYPVRLQLVLWAMQRNISLPLPSPAVEPLGSTPWPQLQERWQAASSQMRDSLELPGAARRSSRPFDHPIVGALSAREMLRLNQVHNAYHLRQLKALLLRVPLT